MDIAEYRGLGTAAVLPSRTAPYAVEVTARMDRAVIEPVEVVRRGSVTVTSCRRGRSIGCAPWSPLAVGEDRSSRESRIETEIAWLGPADLPEGIRGVGFAGRRRARRIGSRSRRSASYHTTARRARRPAPSDMSPSEDLIDPITGRLVMLRRGLRPGRQPFRETRLDLFAMDVLTLRVPKTLSSQVKRHVDTRGGVRRVGHVYGC